MDVMLTNMSLPTFSRPLIGSLVARNASALPRLVGSFFAEFSDP